MWTIYNSHSSIQYVRYTITYVQIERIPILIKIILLFVFENWIGIEPNVYRSQLTVPRRGFTQAQHTNATAAK